MVGAAAPRRQPAAPLDRAADAERRARSAVPGRPAGPARRARALVRDPPRARRPRGAASAAATARSYPGRRRAPRGRAARRRRPARAPREAGPLVRRGSGRATRAAPRRGAAHLRDAHAPRGRHATAFPPRAGARSAVSELVRAACRRAARRRAGGRARRPVAGRRADSSAVSRRTVKPLDARCAGGRAPRSPPRDDGRPVRAPPRPACARSSSPSSSLVAPPSFDVRLRLPLPELRKSLRRGAPATRHRAATRIRSISSPQLRRTLRGGRLQRERAQSLARLVLERPRPVRPAPATRASFSSARCRRCLKLPRPAASSISARRSAGFDERICSTRPWPMTACISWPRPASAEQLQDVGAADVGAVDQVLALAAAVQAPGDARAPHTGAGRRRPSCRRPARPRSGRPPAVPTSRRRARPRASPPEARSAPGSRPPTRCRRRRSTCRSRSGRRSTATPGSRRTSTASGNDLKPRSLIWRRYMRAGV